jgi:hypothetical protein
MKKALIIFGISFLIILSGIFIKKKIYNPKHKLEIAKNEVKELSEKNEIQNGDLIFQTSLSNQSKAIQVATKSNYSHCGIIFKKENDSNNWYVIEAVQPVKWTLLEKWIARGKDGHYVIKRVSSDPMLPEARLLKLKTNAEKYLGKNYDLTFEWSDDKIYCSELLWKVYQKTTGIEIGKLEKLKDFDLTNEIVKKKMSERYGKNLPLNEIVISPKSIFESENLITIKSN